MVCSKVIATASYIRASTMFCCHCKVHSRTSHIAVLLHATQAPFCACRQCPGKERVSPSRASFSLGRRTWCRWQVRGARRLS